MSGPLDSFPCLEVRLTVRRTEDGGRTHPVFTGYMPNWWLPGSSEPTLASATVELIDAETLSGGETGVARLYPFAPQLWDDIDVGTEIVMTEGPNHPVGTAVVTRVLAAVSPV